MLARFLRDLGVDGRDIPVDEAERAARYRTTLAGRRMLVVLDNARDAAQVRPLLPGTASCAVLVTTRSRMPDLASTRLVDLNVLDDDEALTLFAKVVGEERAAAEPEATAELLLACAGLPLAIRICAARLATRSGWTIRAMANRLRDEHRRLDEMRAGDLAVRASFQVSFASLPASTDQHGIDPARAFRLLGLWQGPSISSAAAAALFGIPEYPAEDALEVLVDAHLLESTAPGPVPVPRPAPGLFLRTGRGRPARGRTATPRSAACSTGTCAPPTRPPPPSCRTATTCRWTPPTPGHPPLSFAGAEDALGWYDSERANVVAATRQAAASGLHEIAWRLPAPLFIVFNSRGNWADCIATHRIALDSARQAGNRQGEAWVLNNLGDALGVTRDSEGIGSPGAVARDPARDRGPEGRGASGEQPRRRLPAARADGRGSRPAAAGPGPEPGGGLPVRRRRRPGQPGSTLLDLDRAEEAIDYLQQARRTFAEIDLPGRRGLRPAHPRALLPRPWDGTPRPWTACGRR